VHFATMTSSGMHAEQGLQLSEENESE